MSLSATTITAAIADLVISGVTVLDVSEIPSTVTVRDCPVLFPMPGNWLGSGSGTPDEETSFGTPSSRYWKSHRVFTYVFIYAPVGTGRAISEQYTSASAFMDSIPTAVVQLDVSGVDLENITHKPLGVIEDATGAKFIGTNFDFAFTERINP